MLKKINEFIGNLQNQVIEVTSSINLTGKVTARNHFVMVCDATNGPITITLPDSNSIKNVCIVATKKDSTENAVSFSCRSASQKINSSDYAKLLYRNDSIMLFPYKNGYVIGSINQTV
jgi:hypothetical protein